eukprot:GABV01010404.1.p1 GENE.GABV01010404.1~~GABV01010404.1.p1  ORF type:complete len:115 (+),score=18.88 GABV01010404.1:115-459(+)
MKPSGDNTSKPKNPPSGNNYTLLDPHCIWPKNGAKHAFLGAPGSKNNKDDFKDTALGDFFGGLTVALMLIPQGMAYALIAQLEPQHGLYAAFLPPTCLRFFWSLRANFPSRLWL